MKKQVNRMHHQIECEKCGKNSNSKQTAEVWDLRGGCGGTGHAAGHHA